ARRAAEAAHPRAAGRRAHRRRGGAPLAGDRLVLDRSAAGTAHSTRIRCRTVRVTLRIAVAGVVAVVAVLSSAGVALGSAVLFVTPANSGACSMADGGPANTFEGVVCAGATAH